MSNLFNICLLSKFIDGVLYAHQKSADSQKKRFTKLDLMRALQT